jgi:phosphoribosylformylglycinamidine cyclo-ligase
VLIQFLLSKVEIKAFSHITGGGFLENIPRVLPAHTCAVLDQSSWQMPAIFEWLMQMGNVELMEMYRTFNCGIGMVLVVAESELPKALSILSAAGEEAWHLGEIKVSDTDEQVSFIN